MSFEIRNARANDLEEILGLIRDFAEYEKLEDYLETSVERLSEVLFGKTGFVESLVAEAGGRLVAYSLFYPNFSSFRGQRGLYLEDIYVSPEYRGSGVGQTMLRSIARLAKDQGCERIDFLVLDWNRTAIEFYEKLGAQRDETERHYKFTDKAFSDLAS